MVEELAVTCACRRLQQATGGITEFVPLPFVHMEAPMFRKGLSRRGPTLHEAVLLHAVARLVLFPEITNIQVRPLMTYHCSLSSSLVTGSQDSVPFMNAMCPNAGELGEDGARMGSTPSRCWMQRHGGFDHE